MLDRDRFRSHFAILCVVGLLMTSAVAARGVQLFAPQPKPQDFDPWPTICWIMPYLWFCPPRPIDPVFPDIEPTPDPPPCQIYGPCGEGEE